MSSSIQNLLHIPGTVLIDDWQTEDRKTYVFTDPVRIITACAKSDVESALDEIHHLQASGKHLVGYLAYDCGFGLDNDFESRHESDVPLVWMGVYGSVRTYRGEDTLVDYDPAGCVSNLHYSTAPDDYLNNVQKIQDYIRNGDVYQVNYTTKVYFENRGTAAGLFARLRRAHPVRHSCFVNTGDMQIASLSPELFLKRSGKSVLTRPMKGTVRRGRWHEEDEDLAQALSSDIKNRAENVMIVDLMRNDIGRVCEFGSVKVPALFSVEKYRSVHQMTSDVVGTLREGTTAADIIRATFPPGSITGAPKIRSMEIIDELEGQSRGVYCGCIGMFEPSGDFLLNVAIRTIVQRGNRCDLGIGSGITIGSNPDDELTETMLKSEFIFAQPTEFQLIETLRYDSSHEFTFFDEHIGRICKSAEYFGWTVSRAKTEESLKNAQHAISSSARVRLLLSQSGEVEVEWSRLDETQSSPVKLLLSSAQTDPDNVFLYHKTTNRMQYDKDLAEARKRGYFDVLYTNTNGELTECAITNIMMLIDGQWITPSIGCGLLPGIYRDHAIRSKGVTEGILRLEDLYKADRLVICNSVRGEIEVDAIESEDSAIWSRKRA